MTANGTAMALTLPKWSKNDSKLYQNVRKMAVMAEKLHGLQNGCRIQEKFALRNSKPKTLLISKRADDHPY